MKKSDKTFKQFGEAYFTTVHHDRIKGWNKHKHMTLNLIVIEGEVTFVIFDDRKKSQTSQNFYTIKLSLNNYARLTVPPELWMAFKGSGSKKNLILNLSDLEHDPNEMEKRSLDDLFYDWQSC